MRRSQRLIAAAVLIVFSTVLAGCSSSFGSDFDPTDLLDWLDTKKKLPGDRKPVFPSGVPGMEQGVPKEMYKGAPQDDPNGLLRFEQRLEFVAHRRAIATIGFGVNILLVAERRIEEIGRAHV